MQINHLEKADKKFQIDTVEVDENGKVVRVVENHTKSPVLENHTKVRNLEEENQDLKRKLEEALAAAGGSGKTDEDESNIEEEKHV